jgi:hypothetical protein
MDKESFMVLKISLLQFRHHTLFQLKLFQKHFNLFPVLEAFVSRQNIKDAIQNGKCLLLLAINLKNNAQQLLQSIGERLITEFQE